MESLFDLTHPGAPHAVMDILEGTPHVLEVRRQIVHILLWIL